MMDKVKLGLIGFGRLGAIHAENIAKSDYAELFAICDTNPGALQKAKNLYDTQTYADMDEFLQQPIDGVVIASNTHLHIEHIRKAAKAGKHIFSEKPIGLSLEEADTALQEVVDAGVKFQIGFQRRWDPRYLEAKKAILEGKIGDPILFKAYGRDPNASEPVNWGLDKNGGLFLNAAIHDYDAARFLLDSEVNSVAASGAALVYQDLVNFNDIDTCSTTLLFRNSTMAITEWSRYATYGYDVGAEVIGTKGAIQIGKHSDGVTIKPSDPNAPGVIDIFREAYRLEIDAFAKAVANNTPTSPGLEDARIALQLALRARDAFNAKAELTVTDLGPLRHG